jgi:hypothetical protein
MRILFEIEKEILNDYSPKNSNDTMMALLDMECEEHFGDVQTVIDRDGNFAYGLGNDSDGHRLVRKIFKENDKNIENLNFEELWTRITEEELRDILDHYMEKYCG